MTGWYDGTIKRERELQDEDEMLMIIKLFLQVKDGSN